MHGDMVNGPGRCASYRRSVTSNQLDGGAANVDKDDVFLIPTFRYVKAEGLRIKRLHRCKILRKNGDMVGCF